MVIVVQLKFDLFQMIDVGEEDNTSINENNTKKKRTEKKKQKKNKRKRKQKKRKQKQPWIYSK